MPFIDAKPFQNCSITCRDRLISDLNSAEIARQDAVQGKTHEDQDRAWSRWLKYCESVGLENDIYLADFSKPIRNQLIGAFAMAMRERRFSRKSHGPLAEGTVRGTISFVSPSFRDNGKTNPTKDEDGDLTRVLSRLYRAFRNKDPNPKQQKALPAQVLAVMYKNKQTETQRAIGQLGIGAFFWAMRSCEYLKVPQAEKRRTDILRLRNVRFFLKGVLLGHDDPQCEFATSVAIIFEFQKKDEKKRHSDAKRN